MRYTFGMSRFGLAIAFAAWLTALQVGAADHSAAGPAAFPDTADSTVKVWVRLADKGPSSRGPSAGPAAGPAAGATAREPAGRAYEDKAVHEPYISALEAAGFACDTRLKWQNMVSGRIPRSGLARLRGLPFVTGVSELPRKAPRKRDRWSPWIPESLRKPAAPSAPPTSAFPGARTTLPDLGQFQALADTLNLLEVMDWMDKSGMQPGKGMRVAVLDADFDLGHQAFARLRNEGRIRDQYDFVDKRPTFVTANLADSHGAQCLSLIGGYLPDVFVGGAYEAEFLLYRTEDVPNESYVEEDYQAAAVERAVDSGAQVISISVVYRTEFDSTPDIPLAQMDGRTRPASLAALGAARRNVLVVSAMGNWDYVQDEISSLSVPSDADSILAVGIVNRAGSRCVYSTTGPTADRRVKPELVSMGLAGSCSVELPNVYTAQGLTAAEGTSFAAPAVAAIAVLLRQAQPGKSAEDIRQSLLSTARNAAAPDNQLGWGLPDAWAALGSPQVSVRRFPAVTRAGAGGRRFDAAGRLLGEAPAAGMRFRFQKPGTTPGEAGSR